MKLQPQCKTQSNCFREFARILELESHMHWNKLILLHEMPYGETQIPNFEIPENWSFAITVIEGKPVFIGDKLWHIELGQITLDSWRDIGYRFQICNLSWNPPKPKTVMVELPIKFAEYYANMRALSLSEIEERHAIVGNACLKSLEKLK